VFNPHRFSICRSPTHIPTFIRHGKKSYDSLTSQDLFKQTRGTTLFVILTKKNIESWNHRERQIPFTLSLSLFLSSHFSRTTEPRWSWLRLNPLRRHRRSSISNPNPPPMDRSSLLLLLFTTTTISIFFFDLTTADESPMIFPLSYSSLPPRPRVEDFRRRRLHQSQLPNAHMKLYDDLLSNGFVFSI